MFQIQNMPHDNRSPIDMVPMLPAFGMPNRLERIGRLPPQTPFFSATSRLLIAAQVILRRWIRLRRDCAHTSTWGTA